MAANKLRELFPMIRTHEEIQKEIKNNRNLRDIFESWDEKRQKEFLDSCSGMKGIKILYDSFFKTVMDPEHYPGRLSELLSLLLGRNVHVLRALPNEGGRITPQTLVIMDIIVQLEDGSITTVEVQKYGYAFPGQRAACYSADMLLRQYKKKRDEAAEKKKPLNYRTIRPVYTIVLYENSPGIFHQFPETCIHHFQQTSDTGLEMELLERYTFVALDIFKSILHNKSINSKLEAWLVFLSVDEPEWMERLLREYPEFQAMYSEIYELCRNLEEVMGMYSKELQELDEGTIQYMIDEMQEQIREKDVKLKEKDNTLKEQSDRLREKDNTLKEQSDRLREKDNTLKEQSDKLKRQDDELKEARLQIEEMRRRLLALEGVGK